MYIAGKWIELDKKFAVFNPANGEQIAEVSDGDAGHAREAIAAAASAFPAWSGAGAYARAAMLYRAHELMMKKQKTLAALMTREQGKPLKAAMNEVKYAADFLLWYAEEGKRVYGETIPSARSDQRFLVHRQAIGVVAAITPWNYPVSMNHP